MKRGIVITIFTILLISLVLAAPTVVLTAPIDGATESSSSVTFNCQGSSITENITLYTDKSGTWQAEVTAIGDTINTAISGFTDGTYKWNCMAANLSEGNGWATANKTFTVSAGTSNPVEFNGPIPNQTWQEDNVNTDAFDLDTYFNYTDTVTYDYEGNSKITIAIDTNNVVTFTPDGNFSGSESVRFSAFNTSAYIYSNYITLNVTNVNDDPYLSTNIPNQTIDKNTEETITLSTYFSDPDGDTLNYSVSSTTNLNITINGSIATITPNTDWTGTEDATFTATDGTESVDSNEVPITVGESTTTSGTLSIDTYSPTSDPTLSLGDEQDFTISHSGGGTATWYLDNVEKVTGNDYTFYGEEEGTFTVKVEVSDGTDTETHSWSIVVSSGSDFTTEDEDVDSIIAGGTDGS